MYIPRLRYINDAVNEIREEDPESPVTYDLIRALIEDGKITKIKYGNAWLVNLDELYLLFGGEANATTNDIGTVI